MSVECGGRKCYLVNKIKLFLKSVEGKSERKIVEKRLLFYKNFLKNNISSQEYLNYLFKLKIISISIRKLQAKLE